jgi:hypothetical protein
MSRPRVAAKTGRTDPEDVRLMLWALVIAGGLTAEATLIVVLGSRVTAADEHRRAPYPGKDAQMGGDDPPGPPLTPDPVRSTIR